MSLKKVSDQTAAAIVLYKFSEMIKNLSDLLKSETFVYFTKITAAPWFIIKIIPVSIALPPVDITSLRFGDEGQTIHKKTTTLIT